MYLLAQGATSAASELSPWAQFGLAGIVIGALFFYILHKDKSHSSEREGYRSDIKEIASRHDEVATKMTERFTELHKQTLEVIAKRDRNE